MKQSNEQKFEGVCARGDGPVWNVRKSSSNELFE